jgi:hypothetical protein
MFRYYRITSSRSPDETRAALREARQVDVLGVDWKWFCYRKRLLLAVWLGDYFAIRHALAIDSFASRVLGTLRAAEQGSMLELQVPRGTPLFALQLVLSGLVMGFAGLIAYSKLRAANSIDPRALVVGASALGVLFLALVAFNVATPWINRAGREEVLRFIEEACGVPRSAWEVLQSRPESLPRLVTWSFLGRI